jgi:predicted enzyme related to lactoylglutathione lyase
MKLETISLGIGAMLLAAGAQAAVTLNAARVGAQDVLALVTFYENAFGLKEVNRLEFPGNVEVMLNFGATTDAAKSNSAAEVVIMHRESNAIDDPVPHIIFNVSDIKATAAAVTAAGGKMDGEPREFGDSGIMIGFARDPAGNRIELIQQPQR